MPALSSARPRRWPWLAAGGMLVVGTAALIVMAGTGSARVDPPPPSDEPAPAVAPRPVPSAQVTLTPLPETVVPAAPRPA